MRAFDVLGDPVRRRILELLAEGEQRSGVISEIVRREFGISQPGVSQHLRILREHGLTTVRAEGTRRVYSIRSGPLQEVDDWLERFRGFWGEHLDALSAEVTGSRRPGDTIGSRTPGDANGSRTPGNANGSRTPGDANGSGRPGNANGSGTPGNVNGSGTPGDASSSHRAGDGDGGHQPGRAGGPRARGTANGGHKPGRSTGVHRPGDADGAGGGPTNGSR